MYICEFDFFSDRFDLHCMQISYVMIIFISLLKIEYPAICLILPTETHSCGSHLDHRVHNIILARVSIFEYIDILIIL